LTEETNPAPNQKQKSNKGVKKGTVRGPYKKKSQENIENKNSSLTSTA